MNIWNMSLTPALAHDFEYGNKYGSGSSSWLLALVLGYGSSSGSWLLALVPGYGSSSHFGSLILSLQKYTH